MGQKRASYDLATKVKLLDVYASGEYSEAAVAKDHEVAAGTFHNWVANEKAIRAAFAKEQKQAGKANGHSNGHVSPKAKPESTEEPSEPKLGIIGLTPMLERVVERELDKRLPALVEEGIRRFFASKSAS